MSAPEQNLQNIKPESMQIDNIRATPSFITFLQAFNISLAVTSYSAHCVMVICAREGRLHMEQLPVAKPRGIAAYGNLLTIGSYSEVLNFQRSDHLLDEVNQAEERRHDCLYMPRNTHITGELNIHDMAWGDEGLWFVNSQFSCLCTLQPDISFLPRWKPFFIDQITPDGTGHLNGLGMENGMPSVVTCFSVSGEKQSSWREQKDMHTGALIDVATNRILMDGLVMPHSPRVYGEHIYVCESGYGRVWRYSRQTRQKELVLEVPGFTRGLQFIGGYMLVGLSRVRPSSILGNNPLAQLEYTDPAGLLVFDLATMEVIARCECGDMQIYDLAVIENTSSPWLVPLDHHVVRDHFSYPPLQAALLPA